MTETEEAINLLKCGAVVAPWPSRSSFPLQYGPNCTGGPAMRIDNAHITPHSAPWILIHQPHALARRYKPSSNPSSLPFGVPCAL